ncbi:unnamed protein product [Candida verbasci]|uniref:Uncharacterized protein n=1 Tax=Candida verbasci TaxID=1227364 RepID=A0A9W4TZF2_9ASCO|nr:unnamed protein product [Candida verbasci]
MSDKRDRDQILHAFEDNYARDLAIHLYSIVLLHRINPLFPKNSYYNWPLTLDLVPIPPNNYEDDIYDQSDFEEDIDVDEARTDVDYWNYIKSVTRTRQIKMLKDPETKSAESNENDQDYVSNIDWDKPIMNVMFREKLPNSKPVLLNAISSVIQSKIRSKIKEKQTADQNDEVLKYFSTKIANKFEAMLNQFILSKDQTWIDVIDCGIKSEVSPYKKINTWSYRQLIEKCNALFNDIRYDYEFDDDKVPPDVKSNDGTFNVMKYLESLKDIQGGWGQLTYEQYYERYLPNLNDKIKREAQLNLEMDERLRLQKSGLFDNSTPIEDYILK